jgi:hypothetical protein
MWRRKCPYARQRCFNFFSRGGPWYRQCAHFKSPCTIVYYMEEIIDFDAASAAWMKHKIKLQGGWYAYRCRYIHRSSGERCKKAVEASCPKRKYSAREDWIARTVSRYSHRFCWQHRIAGPQKYARSGCDSDTDE